MHYDGGDIDQGSSSVLEQNIPSTASLAITKKVWIKYIKYGGSAP